MEAGSIVCWLLAEIFIKKGWKGRKSLSLQGQSGFLSNNFVALERGNAARMIALGV